AVLGHPRMAADGDPLVRVVRIDDEQRRVRVVFEVLRLRTSGGRVEGRFAVVHVDPDDRRVRRAVVAQRRDDADVRELCHAPPPVEFHLRPCEAVTSSAMGVLLPIGTRKGLFLLRRDDRETWEVEGPLLEGWAVYHAVVDPRDGTLHACTNNPVYGATVHRSADGGETWERAEELGLPEDGELKLNATWHIEPGRDSELWLGGDPGVLFRSDDGGRTWQLNRALFEHPTRERWQPGAGGMCTHSIQLVGGAIYVAISAAGAFRSDDGGESWTPINKSVAAEFMPDPYPEV